MAYLRLVRFTLSQGSLAQTQIMAEDLVPSIKEQPGCGGASFFGGGDDGECGITVLWDSHEQADATATVIGPRLQQYLGGNATGQPEMSLFSVIAS